MSGRQAEIMARRISNLANSPLCATCPFIKKRNFDCKASRLASCPYPTPTEGGPKNTDGEP